MIMMKIHTICLSIKRSTISLNSRDNSLFSMSPYGGKAVARIMTHCLFLLMQMAKIFVLSFVSIETGLGLLNSHMDFNAEKVYNFLVEQ